MSELRVRIEALRKELLRLAARKNYDFKDPEVLRMSEELDRLINCYYNESTRQDKGIR